MAIPYYTPSKPYSAPKMAGSGTSLQEMLYKNIAAGNSMASQLPPGEFGSNTSTPARVGDTGATSPFSPTRGNLGDNSVPATPPSSSSSSSSSNGGGNTGFDDDPILAKVKAMWDRNVEQASASALAQRKQQEIQFGYDPNVKYEDPATQQAAQQNEFSTLSNLLYNHGERAHQLDEQLNKSNLFYSGERGHQIGREGRQYTLEQSQAGQGFQSNLAAIGNALLQTQMQAQQAILAEEENAYMRAIARGDVAGGGGGSGGGGTSSSDFQRNAPGSVQGKTPDEIRQIAAGYAPTYGGVRFVPSNIAQEGVAPPGYVWVKFTDPTGRQGSSTELVPIG